MVKLEVKVKGVPKPTVKWFRQGEELFPSEEYQMENFDDGTSVLVINNLYEDDTGEITFEAHNALGVAVTTTELSVEGISSTKSQQNVAHAVNVANVAIDSLQISLYDFLRNALSIFQENIPYSYCIPYVFAYTAQNTICT